MFCFSLLHNVDALLHWILVIWLLKYIFFFFISFVDVCLLIQIWIKTKCQTHTATFLCFWRSEPPPGIKDLQRWILSVWTREEHPLLKEVKRHLIGNNNQVRVRILFFFWIFCIVWCVQRTVWGMKVTAIWVPFSSWLLVVRAWSFGAQKFGWTRFFNLRDFFFPEFVYYKSTANRLSSFHSFPQRLNVTDTFDFVSCACVFLIKMLMHIHSQNIQISHISWMSVSLRGSVARFLCSSFKSGTHFGAH